VANLAVAEYNAAKPDAAVGGIAYPPLWCRDWTINLHQFSMRCVSFLAMSPVAALSISFTIIWSTCTGPMCAGSVLDVAILSGMTLRDRKDRCVFMQNFKRWYLMRGSAQMRKVSTSLQIASHLFRTYSRT
jgi:hypothetical protein